MDFYCCFSYVLRLEYGEIIGSLKMEKILRERLVLSWFEVESRCGKKEGICVEGIRERRMYLEYLIKFIGIVFLIFVVFCLFFKFLNWERFFFIKLMLGKLWYFFC